MKYVGNEHVYTFFSKFLKIKFKKKGIILTPDVTPQGVFYLKQGHVRLYLLSEQKLEFTVIIYRPGDVFPLRWAISNIDNIYHFEAITEVELHFAPKRKFIQNLSLDLNFSREIMNQLSYDYGAVIYRIQHLIFGKREAKIASVIITAAKRFGNNNENIITIPFTLSSQQLAIATGMTTQSALVQLHKFQKEGLILFENHIITVLDMEKLASVAYV